MLKKYFLLFFLISSLAACSNNSSSNEGDEQKDMAEFAEDEAFKKAHDEPKELDFTGEGKELTFDTPDGATASAYALLQDAKSDKFLFVIHEWWGLNDQIKREAERLFGALEGVNVLAIDMYDGKVADNRDDAGKYMQAMKPERGEAIVKGALNFAGETAKVATIGWCFGGGWSLKASILASDQGAGCVMYYGMPVQDKEALEPLQADILGIFATQDAWITPEVAEKFKKLAESAEKKIEIHQFEANHAFANPSSEAYIEDAAQKANAMALNFLKERL